VVQPVDPFHASSPESSPRGPRREENVEHAGLVQRNPEAARVRRGAAERFDPWCRPRGRGSHYRKGAPRGHREAPATPRILRVGSPPPEGVRRRPGSE
jgi:hypothetical protein